MGAPSSAHLPRGKTEAYADRRLPRERVFVGSQVNGRAHAKLLSPTARDVTHHAAPGPSMMSHVPGSGSRIMMAF